MEGVAKRRRFEMNQLPVPDDPNPDPFTDLINDGRVHIQPTSCYGHPTVLTIDLDLLAARLIDRLTRIYTYPIFSGRYTDAEVETAVTHMVNAAMLVTYNRLRAVALRYSSQAFRNQMRHQAPFGNRFEFPAFLASILSSIGPLRVKDAPVDSLIIYATPASKMETYGRSVFPEVKIRHVERFIGELQRLKVRLAPIEYQTSIGSFFTTIEPCLRDALWSFDGMLHPAHYENEDIMRAYFCLHPDLDLRGFDRVSMTVEFCTDEAVVAAVRAARPEGVAADVNGDDERVFHRHISFPVNLFGIRPADGGGAAEGGEQGGVAGVYIVGRGNRTYYATSLAHNLRESELLAALRYRLMSTS